PQTDGQTERMNQEIETYLRSFVNYRQNDWCSWLPTAEFHYNDKVHSASKQSPFFLNYGFHPWKGNMSTEPSIPAAADFLKELDKVRTEAKAALEANNNSMRSRGEHKSPKAIFSPGTRVWVEATNIRSNRPSAKLDNKRYGPFELIEQVEDRYYGLKILKSWIINNLSPSPLLPRSQPPKFNSQRHRAPPPPDIINEEEEYEVEEIRGHRKRGRGTQFLVHWKGYSNEEDSWLPRSALGNAGELLTEYVDKLPAKSL